MRINLKVNHEDQSHAHKLGAKWDIDKQNWYVENKTNLVPFMKWMNPELTKPVETKKGDVDPNAWKQLFSHRKPKKKK